MMHHRSLTLRRHPIPKMQSMNPILTLPAILLLAAPGAVREAATSTVEGAYLEVRTCDVSTGPCFANGEANSAGKEATLASDIERGAYGGVDLAGLEVVAFVRNGETLGAPGRPSSPLETAIFVDETA